MILTIDVGNTNTVFGVMDGEDVVTTMRVSTQLRTTDETGVLLTQLLALRGMADQQFQGGIISSVVPDVLFSLVKACKRYLGFQALVVGRGLKTGMKVRTDNPREVGADRIVNSVAAIHRYGGPVIVVDFGTATTLDCVNADGEYIGGVIAPGFRISEEALFSRTAKLPRVEVARPPRAIGTNTVQAMQSGLYYGYVGLVDALARRCRDELAPDAQVVATGGLAQLLSEDSDEIASVDPLLTLRGLRLLYDRNVG